MLPSGSQRGRVPERREELLDDAFGVEEVERRARLEPTVAVAVQEAGGVPALVGQLGLGARGMKTAPTSKMRTSAVPRVRLRCSARHSPGSSACA